MSQKQKSPKVSVLMPAYNVEKYVSEAIESILNQTFKDFEFIIINDGSTDNTAKIISEYAKRDKRIRFVDNKKNQGLIGVLNQGLDLCSGEYIARMDSDDISLPTRFAKQVEYMDNHPECGVLGTQYQMFGTKNKITTHPERVKILDLIFECLIGHPTVMLRKSIIDEYNLRYDKNYKYAEDYELWSRMVMITEIHNLQDVLLKYRWHGTNISITQSAAQQHTVNNIHNKFVSLLSNKTDILSRFTKLYRWVYLFSVPFIKIKTYNLSRYKYYLFGYIPLVLIENNIVYLFGFLKIGKIK